MVAWFEIVGDFDFLLVSNIRIVDGDFFLLFSMRVEMVTLTLLLMSLKTFRRNTTVMFGKHLRVFILV